MFGVRTRDAQSFENFFPNFSSFRVKIYIDLYFFSFMEKDPSTQGFSSLLRFLFRPEGRRDPHLLLCPPTCARISSKVEIEGPSVSQLGPCQNIASSSPRVNIMDWHRLLELWNRFDSIDFRKFSISFIYIRSDVISYIGRRWLCGETFESTVSSRREREFSLKVEWKVRF